MTRNGTISSAEWPHFCKLPNGFVMAFLKAYISSFPNLVSEPIRTLANALCNMERDMPEIQHVSTHPHWPMKHLAPFTRDSQVY